MEFNVTRLKKKYQSKKTNAANKGLEFGLTCEQYVLMFMRSNGLCDYTGMVMSDDVDAVNYATLERINSDIGYLPSNVCLIRSDANKVKGEILDTADKGIVHGICSDNKMLAKVCETIYNPTKVEAIKNKYKVLFDSLGKESNTVTNETMQQEEITTMTDTPINPELKLTKMYYEFGTQIESFDVGFELTYGEFKRMVSRKYCQLTNRSLSLDTVTIWVMNKELSVSKSNVMVVESSVAEALDVFVVKADLGYAGLLTLCKNLGMNDKSSLQSGKVSGNLIV